MPVTTCTASASRPRRAGSGARGLGKGSFCARVRARACARLWCVHARVRACAHVCMRACCRALRQRPPPVRVPPPVTPDPPTPSPHAPPKGAARSCRRCRSCVPTTTASSHSHRCPRARARSCPATGLSSRERPLGGRSGEGEAGRGEGADAPEATPGGSVPPSPPACPPAHPPTRIHPYTHTPKPTDPPTHIRTLPPTRPPTASRPAAAPLTRAPAPMSRALAWAPMTRCAFSGSITIPRRPTACECHQPCVLRHQASRHQPVAVRRPPRVLCHQPRASLSYAAGGSCPALSGGRSSPAFAPSAPSIN